MNWRVGLISLPLVAIIAIILLYFSLVGNSAGGVKYMNLTEVCETRHVSHSSIPPCGRYQKAEDFVLLICEQDTFFLGKVLNNKGDIRGFLISKPIARTLFDPTLSCPPNITSWPRNN